MTAQQRLRTRLCEAQHLSNQFGLNGSPNAKYLIDALNKLLREWNRLCELDRAGEFQPLTPSVDRVAQCRNLIEDACRGHRRWGNFAIATCQKDQLCTHLNRCLAQLRQSI
jgi:hypothetical protein